MNISNIRFLHIVNISNEKSIFLKYRSFIENISDVLEILAYIGNTCKVKAAPKKYWIYISNVSDLMSVSKNLLYNAIFFDAEPIFLNYRLFIRNDSNMGPTFLRYWHFTGNISNVILNF